MSGSNSKIRHGAGARQSARCTHQEFFSTLVAAPIPPRPQSGARQTLDRHRCRIRVSPPNRMQRTCATISPGFAASSARVINSTHRPCRVCSVVAASLPCLGVAAIFQQMGVNVMSGSTNAGSGNGATTVFSYSGTLQTFTVSTTGTYDIVAEGAQGGFSDSESVPGKGAEVGGEFQLTAGEMLSIVAGGQGQQANFSGGGSGGSFVYPATALGQPLLAAGGGGGAGAIVAPGGDGQAGTAGSNAANGLSGAPLGGLGGTNGTGGGGGGGYSAGGGGGGYSGGGGAVAADYAIFWWWRRRRRIIQR
jgi:hypothetical protein